MDILILNNGWQVWLTALATGGAAYLVLSAIKALLIRRLRQFAAAPATYLDDVAVEVLSATHSVFILVMGAYAGSHRLALSSRAETVLGGIAVSVLLLQAARWGDVAAHSWLHRHRLNGSAMDVPGATSTAALDFIARSTLWLIAALMILDNLGVNITTLIASLGVGGIAVALAIQNILGDLFSSLSIVLDKPFVVGDFITVDDIAGTVEYVGLKTTRIRGLGGEQVVFSNSDLLKSRIRNYKRMLTRRIGFEFGVAYETDLESLQIIPAIVREAVSAQPQATFDRAHFKAFVDSALQFEVVYVVGTADYGTYMDIQQAINLRLFERFQEVGIEFAYPTRTIRIVQADQGIREQPAGSTQATNSEQV